LEELDFVQGGQFRGYGYVNIGLRQGARQELRALFSEGKLILSGDDGNQMIFNYK
jgi:hypothetical protein